VLSLGVRTGVGILLVVVLGVFIWTKIIPVSNPFITCYPMKEIRQSAPDNKHVLSLVNQLCAGGVGISSHSYWITIRRLPEHNDEGIQIFYTWDYAPDVAWVDSKNIIVTILQVCQVRTSLHEAGAIRVTYRLADNLLPNNFREKMDDYERQAIEAAAKGLTSDARDPTALKRRIEFAWSEYDKLMEWAVTNAVNAK
jgi:hypothetical protein